MAIDEELKCLVDIKTWEAVQRPDGAHVVGSKWVFKAKKDTMGNIVKYKARLVAQRFMQISGVDYFETYSPVVKLTSL